MEVTKQKRNKKPLYILMGALCFFGIFIYCLTRPSELSKANVELETCFTKKDVEMCWYKYKTELYKNQDFVLAIKKKLQNLNLSSTELEECKSWLPPAPISINILVVPDLSRRIIDTINNPNQVKNDLLILNTIWNSFVERSKLKQDTKDELVIDVTNIEQAKGQFSVVANELQFDLSKHQGKSNRLFFTEGKSNQFKKSIIKLYSLATEKPLGADYHFYFRRYLKNHIKKSTLFETYINRVIIITDGYMESENGPADTKIVGYEGILYNSVRNGNISDVIKNNNLSIPNVDIDLNDVEIMICEANERVSGRGYDFEILNEYWKQWLKKMGVKNLDTEFFLQKEQANDVTLKKVANFISK